MVKRRLTVMNREMLKDGGDCALVIGSAARVQRARTLID